MSQFIGGKWTDGGGAAMQWNDPATGEITWRGRGADGPQIAAAVAAARGAFADWSQQPREFRMQIVRALAEQYRSRRARLAETISRETGKPNWEALAEVDAMIAKAAISIDAMAERCAETSREISGALGVTRFRPHGVLAILGPFNMPGHLPNGHLMPALLAGNAVVFKPSEQSPGVGQMIAECCEAAGIPAGVVNLVQGGREAGEGLVKQSAVDGVLFTGSSAGGRAVNRMLADRPGAIVALEMGGNNPLIVHEAADLQAAAYVVAQSACITAGQRCSCARRLIVCEGSQGDALIDRIVQILHRLRIGFWNDDPQPFMGTLISAAAAERIMLAQAALLKLGAVARVPVSRSERSPALLSPGLLDVTHIADRPDEEYFGPLLQVIRVKNFDAAIAEANRTAYGLSAGLISDDEALYRKFLGQVRAGVIHWNRPLTGASSLLPFGGIGLSGNHRPGGYWAAEYAAYPVGCLEARTLSAAALPPGLTP